MKFLLIEIKRSFINLFQRPLRSIDPFLSQKNSWSDNEVKRGFKTIKRNISIWDTLQLCKQAQVIFEILWNKFQPWT